NESVAHYAARLRHLTFQIRAVSIAVVGTLFGIAVPLVQMAFSFRNVYGTYFGADYLLLASASCLINLVFLFAYDNLKKRGDAIFEELSDELQWRLVPGNETITPKSRPRLDTRIAMREYILSTDLPLTRGKSGMQLYFALSVFLW